MTTTIVLNGNRTTERHGADTTITSTHITPRRAAEYFARRSLEILGWTVRLPGSGEGFRLPLKHRDEPMMQPLDASRPRAAGFTATKQDAALMLDVSGDLPVLFTATGPEHLVAEGRQIIAEAFPESAGNGV